MSLMKKPKYSAAYYTEKIEETARKHGGSEDRKGIIAFEIKQYERLRDFASLHAARSRSYIIPLPLMIVSDDKQMQWGDIE